MATNITQDQAKQMIQKYRNAAPANSLKCALFNTDFIRYLIENTEKEKISGIRAYMAMDEKGQTTVILAATTKQGSLDVDIKTGYYDYSYPCPEMCENGEI